MNLKTWTMVGFFVLSSSAFAEEVVSLKYSPECIFKAILKYKKREPNQAISLPVIFVESRTPLQQFQDAIEPQWNFRPDSFLNAYVASLNEIYLLDKADYYRRTDRFIDDSLAHELTHYFQVKYQNANLADGDDSLEPDAVDVQTWFRETFMKAGRSPCGP